MSLPISPAYRIVGTAGHIDHGKSALVRALTGVDPDRLQEERERGITIDLGFADTTLGELRVGFIDVPGHERFVKNMLAGVGGIDAVLLVVAADESIMPQTREHFAICRLLGIEHGVVAITKCDLVDEELLELVELEVREFLADSPLRDAAVVRTSAREGTGLDELRAALHDCLLHTPERPAEQIARLPIDRVFTVRGFGTVVTGTLLSGSLAAGEAVDVLPAGLRTSIRGIQVHGEPAESVRAGQRAALNLQGVQVEQLGRGDVVSNPDTLAVSYLLDARLEVLPDAEPIRHLQRVRFHHGAAEILGRVAVLRGDEIAPGASGFVQLRLESPYPAAPGDRFIVRRYSPLVTLGGGVVLDPAPRKHRPRRFDTALLRRLVTADAAERVAVWTAEAGLAGLDLETVRKRLACSGVAAHEAMLLAQERGQVTLLATSPPSSVPAAAFERLTAALEAALADYHARYPLRPGAPLAELHGGCGVRVPARIVQAALLRLERDGRIRSEGEAFALPTHVAHMTPELARLGERLLHLFEQAGLAAPPPASLIAQLGAEEGERAREVYHFLLRQGELVRIRDDLVLHADVLAKLLDNFGRRFPRGQTFSVGEFKEWAEITRKHAIPLLEYLDGRRITRRVGDARERI